MVLIVFAIILGIFSLYFISTGAVVLFRRKPILFSAKWPFFLMAFQMLAPLVIQFNMLLTHPSMSVNTTVELVIHSLMRVMMLYSLWRVMQGYIMMGITDDSFRNSLFAALKEQNLEWKEELSLIRIPSENLDIHVSIQSWMGTGQIKNKTKQNRTKFEQVICSLKKQFAVGDIKINSISCIFYIIIGILLLICITR